MKNRFENDIMGVDNTKSYEFKDISEEKRPNIDVLNEKVRGYMVLSMQHVFRDMLSISREDLIKKFG